MSWDAVLIAGPTAGGKSAAALALAEHIGGVVVNADSMQVYRELRVLTARPSVADERRAPHRLYGHTSAAELYSVGRYQEDAARALGEARNAKRVPIFTGGTGLYFDALTQGLSPIPHIDAEIRARVRARFDEMGREAFLAALIARDPGAAKLRVTDTQRLLRAADVLEGTGRPLSQWQQMSGRPVLENLRVARFVIAPPRAVLYERIAHRFAAMVQNGALDEARALRGLEPSLPAAKALGLPQLQRHLAGEASLEAAMEEAQKATRNYVKRQMTWFRGRMGDWKWLEDGNLRNLITLTQ